MKEARIPNLIDKNVLNYSKLILDNEKFMHILNNGASNAEKAEAWLGRARLAETIMQLPNLEDIRKRMPEIVLSKNKIISCYRHSLELNPENPEAKAAYEKLKGIKFEETSLSRLPDSEYEPAVYLPVSPRLKEPLKKPLNEAEEISSYWNAQTKEDKKFIEEIGKQIKKPMHPNCRMTIGIPAYMEGKNIFRTLEEAYAKQKDIDPSEFEVIIFENHPADKTRDHTLQEIERFKKLYPQLNIHHIYYCFPKIAPMGTLRKIVGDLSLKRRMDVKKTDPKKDFIIATADADSYGIKKRSLRYILDTFDEKPDVASITGKFDYPKEALAHYPTLHAVVRFRFMYILTRTRGYSIASSGASSHLRASVYSAIGGFDWKAKRGEDAERGKRVYYYGKGQAPLKFLYTDAARYYTDPRRAIDVMSEGKSWAEQWQDIEWQTNQGKSLGNSWHNFERSNLKNFDKRILENEINLLSREALEVRKKYPHSPFVRDTLSALDRTMKLMGIKAAINSKGDRIVITDTSKLEAGLKKFKERFLPKTEQESEIIPQPNAKEYELHSGEKVTINYKPGKILQIILPGNKVLRIVEKSELNCLNNLEFPSDHFVITDLDLFKKTNGQKGYKGLGNNEIATLGKAEPPFRFDFGPEIADRHVEITRRGKAITITDLDPRKGLIVRI